MEARRDSCSQARLASAMQTGQSLIEFALSLPFLLLLIVNTVNFGGYFFATITVASAARAGSQYRVLGGASIGAPAPPSAAQIFNLVTTDMSPLLNAASLAVRVCTQTMDASNNPTTTCDSSGTGTFADPPSDTRSEGHLYALAWVDVQYTYQPYIGALNFPALGIYTTLPPSTIRRQSVMRMLQ